MTCCNRHVRMILKMQQRRPLRLLLLLPVLMLVTVPLLPMARVAARDTSYLLLSSLGRGFGIVNSRAALNSRRATTRTALLTNNANSWYRSSIIATSRRHFPSSPSSSSRLLRRQRQFGSTIATTTRQHMVLDFFDPLEPFELAWEFYCKRYEILDELVAKLVAVTKRNSIRAIVAFGGAIVVGEVLARIGVLGQRGEGLATYFQNSERFNEGSRERVYQKAGSFLIDKSVDVLQTFRHFGGKSKFAISVSVGVFFGQFIISTTVFAVKTVMISFFFLETLSFLGVIGDMGESILDWIDDEFDDKAQWTVAVARFHKGARKRMSFDWLEELYEAAVDEEKIASFGFSLGTVISLLS